VKKVLFCRVVWMDSYRGPKGDKPLWGGLYAKEQDHWDELYNYEPHKGDYYGNVYMYVFDVGHLNINIGRLGADPGDQTVEDVLIVWVAGRPHFGPVVVGWFDHATVYSPWRELSTARAKRRYYFRAKVGDCVLLDRDQRVLVVPTGKGGMGQRNTWFPPSRSAFVVKLQQRIAAFRRGRAFSSVSDRPSKKPGGHWQPDLEKRLAVERRAVIVAIKYFEERGYKVEDRQTDRVGWDYDARLGDVLLKLEIKGQSGDEVLTELTSNELSASVKYRDNYRICIVTDVLDTPRLRVFRYSMPRKAWIDDNGTGLDIERITVTTAKLSLTE